MLLVDVVASLSGRLSERRPGCRTSRRGCARKGDPDHFRWGNPRLCRGDPQSSTVPGVGRLCAHVTLRRRVVSVTRERRLPRAVRLPWPGRFGFACDVMWWPAVAVWPLRGAFRSKPPALPGDPYSVAARAAAVRPGRVRHGRQLLDGPNGPFDRPWSGDAVRGRPRRRSERRAAAGLAVGALAVSLAGVPGLRVL